MTYRPRPRSGFTLIEMLVVIGIMVIIATLGYLLIPNLSRNKGVPNAVTQLEGWIRVTKGQALRDGAPRGIRLVMDPNNPTRVTYLQYIEQPEPLAPRGPLQRAYITTLNPLTPLPPPYPNPTPSFVDLVLIDPATGSPVAGANWDDPANPQIDVGDFLELNTSPNLIARITAIGPSGSFPGLPRVRLILDRSVPGTDVNPLLLADGFRIIRAPRPLQGEPMLQMHKDVYIDLADCYPCPVNLGAPSGSPPYGNSFTYYTPWSPTGNIDILFNSNGQVANAPTGQLVLCVKHVDRDEKILVVVYTRTGKVTAVVWNDVGGQDPYLYARDGRASGL
jgi:prepilin-type N-terminal cleavage/methylation domain-containing protein